MNITENLSIYRWKKRPAFPPLAAHFHRLQRTHFLMAFCMWWTKLNIRNKRQHYWNVKKNSSVTGSTTKCFLRVRFPVAIDRYVRFFFLCFCRFLSVPLCVPFVPRKYWKIRSLPLSPMNRSLYCRFVYGCFDVIFFPVLVLRLCEINALAPQRLT